MRDTRVQILKTFPLFTALFSLWVLYVTINVLAETGQSFLVFALLLLQVYLNWLAVLLGNRNCTASRMQDVSYLDYKIVPASDYGNFKMSSFPWSVKCEKDADETKFSDYDFISPAEIASEKVWFCPRCCKNSLESCYHCPVCKKCIIERDHHCFFLGTCISKKNMKHFIILLIYTFLTSSYVTLVLCNKMNLLGSSLTVIVQHFFPVSFARWLSGEEYIYNLIEKFLLNVSASLALFSLAFSAHYMWKVAKSSFSLLKKRDKRMDNLFTEKLPSVFGQHGVVNLIFPTILMRYFLHFSCISNTLKEN